MRAARVGIACGMVLLLAAVPTAALARRSAASSGGLIAFVRDPTSGVGTAVGAIYTAHADGSSIEQLTEPPSGVDDPRAGNQYPAWSSDGKRVAYFCGQPVCGSRVLAAGGAAEVVPVTVSPTVFSSWMVPPGLSSVHWCGSSPEARLDTYQVSPRGSLETDLYYGGLEIGPFGPASADQEPDFTWCGGRYVLTASKADPGVTVAFPAGARAFSWSPDGTRLAVQANDGLWVVNADGGGKRLIFKTPYDLYPGKTGYYAPVVNPVWSPSGRQIAFVEPGGPAYDAENDLGNNETDIWTVGADGSSPEIVIRNATEPSWQPAPAPFHQCSVLPPKVQQLPLSIDEQNLVAQDQADLGAAYGGTLEHAIGQLRRDQALHPSRRGADSTTIATLEHLIGGARSLQSAAGPTPPKVTDAERQLVRDAACGLMDDAVSSLKSFIDDTETVKEKDQAKLLVEKVNQFGQVLTGKIKPESGEATAVLKANVVDLVKQFAGADAAKYVSQGDDLRGKAADLFHILNGSLTQEQLTMLQLRNIGELATRIGGKEAGDLANQLITFRSMLSGRATEDEQFAALKTAFVDLATRLVGSNIMKTPQVRAAMLGFKIGTALGNSIAANLKLIQKIALVRACGTALHDVQARAGLQSSSYADLDYGASTRADVTRAISVAFDDSTCQIHPEGRREGVKGGVVEVLLPTYFLGVGWKNGYTTVYYDPTWTSQG
jgi:hypothetical protein